MSQVIDLAVHYRSAGDTTLVLLDMQQEHLRVMPASETARSVNNCLRALRHARSHRFQVAFARWNGPGAFFYPAAVNYAWIEGFTPNREDLVFERSRPSCYSSSWFNDVISQRSGRFVLAGFSGEVACLATIIDAFHHNHLVTLLVDATASRQLVDIAACDVHRVIGRVADLFGRVVTTDEWITHTSHSDLVKGKNVEGRV